MIEDSRKILYSKGKNDECMTPVEAVIPLLEFLEPFKNRTIWCPFDRDDSNFVKILRDNGFDVINTHISYGQDFYEYEPLFWDVIVSNPPFTNKRKIFERCMKLGKPFALLMTNVWLNDAAPWIVLGEDMQLLAFTDRINFLDENGYRMGKPTFASSYYCYKLLPKQICVRNLKGGNK